MTEPTMSNRLTMHWVEVVDESGRSRMESRWSVTGQAQAPHATHAA